MSWLAVLSIEGLDQSIKGEKTGFSAWGSCRLALIHLALEKTYLRGWPDPCGPGQSLSGFPPAGSVGRTGGLLSTVIFRLNMKRPFRCSREWGGEDSCGGF